MALPDFYKMIFGDSDTVSPLLQNASIAPLNMPSIPQDSRNVMPPINAGVPSSEPAGIPLDMTADDVEAARPPQVRNAMGKPSAEMSPIAKPAPQAPPSVQSPIAPVATEPQYDPVAELTNRIKNSDNDMYRNMLLRAGIGLMGPGNFGQQLQAGLSGAAGALEKGTTDTNANLKGLQELALKKQELERKGLSDTDKWLLGQQAMQQKADANQRNSDLLREKLDIARSKIDLMATNNMPENKPLPTPALKLQNGLLEDVAISKNLEKNSAELYNALNSKKLTLGPLNNAANKAQNWMGLSNSESQEYANLVSALQKRRNDSLRLNKGTQTEGDAVRAWDELFENMNDNKVVGNKLKSLEAMDKQAADIKKSQINEIRGNYGHPEYDFSKFDNIKQTTRVGVGGDAPQSENAPPSSSSGWSIKKVQ